MKNLLATKRLVWGLMFVLMIAGAGLSYRSGSRYIAAAQAVEQALAVRAAIDETLSQLKDAETGQRGFLITGENEFLEPYHSAVEGLPRSLDQLRRATRQDPVQIQRLAQLDRLAREKLAFMGETIRIRTTGDVAAANARVRGGQGKALMDAVRVQCHAMVQHQDTVLHERRRRADAAQRIAVWGVASGSGLAILLALFGLLTVQRDVQTLQHAADQARKSGERFRLLTENSGDLVRLLDLNGKVTYVSPAVERLLGFGVQEFLELPAKSLMHPDDLPTAGRILSDIASGAVQNGISTYRLRNKSGKYRYFEVRWSTQKDAAGAPTSIHTTGRDVTERRLAEEQLADQAEQLRSLSLRDELTKLYNRRGFMEVARQAQTQARRDRRPAAVVFIDLNGMKQINDQLGHDAGDDALLDTAEVLRKAFGESDVIARLGGDEFVGYSVDLTPTALEELRARVRTLADQVVATRSRPYRLSMSVGAAFSEHGSPESLPELLEKADAAMYRQKKARQAAGNVSSPPPAGPDQS